MMNDNILVKFKISNHNLLIEQGRYQIDHLSPTTTPTTDTTRTTDTTPITATTDTTHTTDTTATTGTTGTTATTPTTDTTRQGRSQEKIGTEAISMVEFPA